MWEWSERGVPASRERAESPYAVACAPNAALAAADQLKRDPANMPAAAALRGDVYMSQRRFADAATAYAAEMKAAPSSALALRAAAADGVAEATIGWSDPAAAEGGAAPARTHRFALGGLVEAHAAISRACEEAPTAAPAATPAACAPPR